MTEREYLIEMLCCIPKELLIKRKNGNASVPEWLKETAIEDVNEALRSYDVERYKKIRDDSRENI